jgi:hypothetical protein
LSCAGVGEAALFRGDGQILFTAMNSPICPISGPRREGFFDLWLSREIEVRTSSLYALCRRRVEYFYHHVFSTEGISMYPTVPAELFSGAAELVSYFFTMIAVLITLAVTTRG